MSHMKDVDDHHNNETLTSDISASFHVAIIMDGNGRWAKARHQIRSFGHHAGVVSLRRTIKAAIELGISHLTVFAFSTENWRRPEDEVLDLMGLLKAFIKSDLDKLNKENVCIRIIGQRQGLAPDIIECINLAEQTTKDNKRFYLQVALNYGAQADIVEAAKHFALMVQEGRAKIDDLTPQNFGGLLSSHALPALDLLIRTSGEYRLSNFLLWEAAYAEFVFQDILWPDYDKSALQSAINTYKSRDRRFGGIESNHKKSASPSEALSSASPVTAFDTGR